MAKKKRSKNTKAANSAASPSVAKRQAETTANEGDDQSTATRTLWSGTISFGLVSVPVALLPAVRDTGVSLRMLDKDGTPLRRRYYCPRDNQLVHSEHIIRGYRLDDEHYITVTQQELESLEPRKSRDIDLRLFVDRQSITPDYFDRPYFLVPATESTKAYRLLAQVMQQSHRAGIATFVMRDREYLVAIFADHDVLRAQTMRFAEELRSAEEVGLPQPHEVSRQMVSRFEQALAAHEAAFDPADLDTGDEQKLLQLIEEKQAQGRDIVQSEIAADEAGEPSIQHLMEALEQSIHASKRRKSA